MKKIYYDMMSDFGGSMSDEVKTDYKESKELLLEIIMKRCGITSDDLHDISIVKSKLRDQNIDEILN